MTEAAQSRRAVLRLLGLGSSAVVALPLATAREAEAYDPGREERRTRYRGDSEHIQAFYRTNRYES